LLLLRAPLNRLALQASLVSLAGPRYTPAGIPVADLLLEHNSTQEESGQERRVALQIKGIAFGVLAERLLAQTLGVTLQMHGFLSNARNGKGLVFHIQDFQSN